MIAIALTTFNLTVTNYYFTRWAESIW